MIKTTKVRQMMFGAPTTFYMVEGHARTDICNGFSLLICTFCEVLKHDASDLKYVFERSDGKHIFFNGSESDEEPTGEETSYVEYRGDPLEAEKFFETGIKLLNSEFPEEVAPLSVTVIRP